MGFRQAAPWEEREVSQSALSTGTSVAGTSHAVHHFLAVHPHSPPDRMRDVWINLTVCSVSYKLEKDAAGLPFGFLWSLIASPLYHLVSLSPASFTSIFENDEQSSVICPEGDCQNVLNYAVVQYSLSSLSPLSIAGKIAASLDSGVRIAMQIRWETLDFAWFKM